MYKFCILERDEVENTFKILFSYKSRRKKQAMEFKKKL